MEYSINITPDAQGDIRYLKAYEQRIIMRSIREFLTYDVRIETNRRKALEPNQIGSWELRIDIYRIFYDIEEATVYITAVGYKDHNDLYIRGRKVTL